MEKFLEKFQADIENKMLACVRGESIIKPFDQIYEKVREKPKKISTHEKAVVRSYSEAEHSIYSAVVKSFLEEHPELLEK
jgi:hypothetical protein